MMKDCQTDKTSFLCITSQLNMVCVCVCKGGGVSYCNLYAHHLNSHTSVINDLLLKIILTIYVCKVVQVLTYCKIDSIGTDGSLFGYNQLL